MKKAWSILGLTIGCIGFCICLKGIIIKPEDILPYIGLGINFSVILLNYLNLKD